MNILYRKATIKDIELLVQLRFDFLSVSGQDINDNERNQLYQQLKGYFRTHLPDDSFICMLAEYQEQIAATAFLCVDERPASLAFITGKTGILLNVFTYPAFQRKGLATNILKLLFEEAKKQNISRLELSATQKGEALYRTLGFTASSHIPMKKNIPLI